MTHTGESAPDQEGAPDNTTALSVSQPVGRAGDVAEATPDVDEIVRAALALAQRGWHVFPVDHPSLPTCAGAHLPSHKLEKCKRGKCPAVD